MSAPLRHFPVALALVVLVVVVAFAPPALAEDLKAEAKARIQNIEQHLEDWNVDDAKSELAELSKLVPDDVEPLLYWQGRVAFEEGRYEAAVDLLTRAGLEDKAGSYLRLAKDTRAVTLDHAQAESEHFVLFYPKGKEEVLVPYALETLEKIRTALKEDLGFVPEGKIRVEFLNNGRELAKVSTLTYEQIRTTGTIAICKFNKLMVTSPKAVVRGYDWQDTLAHEYVHLVVSQRSRNTVPIWLHEGLAKYLESRWRGTGGLALPPSTLALLGSRVKQDKLIPFEKMHPSIALLPTAEDAATAFAEVFFAIDMIHRQHGTAGLRAILDKLKAGATDKDAVAAATGMAFQSFEREWLKHVKSQRFPSELLPLSSEQVVLAEDAPQKAKGKEEKKGKEISFGDFAEVDEVPARKMAHLGELFRERGRTAAAAEEYGKAHVLVGDKYEAVSNKYALALFELRRTEEAERVLLGSLRVHPDVPATHVHLGRIYVLRKDWPQVKRAYLQALAADPFDPEIHVALFKAHGALGEKDAQSRTRRAVHLLTKIPEGDVEKVAAQFLGNETELSNATSVPASAPEQAPAQPPRADAGRP